jgi:short-subunit dehydrogenase
MLQLKRPCYIGQISSIAALQPVSYFTVYSASKSFLLCFSETLSFELKNSNVSMTCICPGGTTTEFFETSGQQITRRGQATLMTVEQVVQGSLRALFNKKRTYVPGFLNQLVCFLPRLLPRKLSLLLAFKVMNQASKRITPRVEKL